MGKKLFTFFVILILSVLIWFFVRTKFGLEIPEEFLLTDDTLWQGLVIGVVLFAFLGLGKVFLKFLGVNFSRTGKY